MVVMCPKCRIPLTQRASEKIVHHVCGQCQKFSVAKLALLELFSSRGIVDVWEKAQFDKKRSHSNCPFCLHPMLYATLERVMPPLIVEACVACESLWMDQKIYDKIRENREKFTSAAIVAPPPVVVINKGIIPPPPPPPGAQRRSQDLPEKIMSLPQTVLAVFGIPMPVEPRERKSYPTTAIFLALASIASTWYAYGHPIIDQKFGFVIEHEIHLTVIRAIGSVLFYNNWFQLGFNVFFFLLFADAVEEEIGSKYLNRLFWASFLFGRFFLLLNFYNFEGHFMNAVGTRFILDGAAGGIAGVVAYSIARFPRHRFRMGILVKTFPVRAWFLGSVYFLQEGLTLAFNFNLKNFKNLQDLQNIQSLESLQQLAEFRPFHLFALTGAFFGLSIALTQRISKKIAARKKKAVAPPPLPNLKKS